MTIRLYIALTIIMILFTLEYIFPYRKRVMRRFERWPGNLLLVLLDVALVKIISPLGLVGVASAIEIKKNGLCNYFELDGLYINLIMFLFLDLMIYFQHFLSHKWSVLWTFHRVHHSDPDLDISSALRFHPIEILYSFLFKCSIVILLGIDPKTVLIFEIVLNGMALFNHANISISKRLESAIRFIFVTPQMHIIHHSIYKKESNKNFGFNFTVWDYIFRTYQDVFSSEGAIGDKKFIRVEDQSFKNLLLQPFK